MPRTRFTALTVLQIVTFFTENLEYGGCIQTALLFNEPALQL